MKINELLNQEEMLRMIELILNNTMAQVRQSNTVPVAGLQTQTLPTVKQAPKLKVVKHTKPRPMPKVKKAPYAAPPKPLPKPMPQPEAVSRAYDQQQQKIAGHIAKAVSDKHKGMMPNSLKQLPTSVLSPIDTVDKDKAQKYELAKREADMHSPKLDKGWVLNHKNGHFP